MTNLSCVSFGSLPSNMSAGEVTLEVGARFSSSLLYPAPGAKGSSCSLLKVGPPVSEVPSSVPLPLVTVADGGTM